MTAPNTKVTLKTSMGDIVIELNNAEAPITTENFLTYVNESFLTAPFFTVSSLNS